MPSPSSPKSIHGQGSLGIPATGSMRATCKSSRRAGGTFKEASSKNSFQADPRRNSSRREASVASSSSSSGTDVQNQAAQGDEMDTEAYVSFEEARPEAVEEMKRKSLAMSTSLSEHVEELKRNDCVKPQAGETWEEAKQKMIVDLEEHDQLNASMTTVYSKFQRGDGQLHSWNDIPPADTQDNVVFMFLVVDGLKNEEWMKAWFADADAKGHKDHYSIVYHRGRAFGKDSDAITDDLLATKGVPVWPATKTGWARNGLVRASILMLRFALENARTRWFVLVSDTCMPVYTFHDLYSMLQKQKQSRFNDFGMTIDVGLQRNIWQRGVCSNEKFSHKADQWSLWIRPDAEWFVRENHLLRLKPLAMFVDEPYFINMMDEFQRPFQRAPTTYTRWYKFYDLVVLDPKNRAEGVKKFTSSPCMFSQVSMERIRRARRRGCLFLRKVGPDADYPKVQDLEIVDDASCWSSFAECLQKFCGYVVEKGHRGIFGPEGCCRLLCHCIMCVCALLTCGYIGGERRARRHAALAHRRQELGTSMTAL